MRLGGSVGGYGCPVDICDVVDPNFGRVSASVDRLSPMGEFRAVVSNEVKRSCERGGVIPGEDGACVIRQCLGGER